MALGLLLLKNQAKAATGIYKTINFQGKVVNSDGTNVADGDYDFVFSLYTVDTAGSAVWTESRTTVNQVTVTDGVFRVALGEVTTLPGSIDFNTDNIYLGINFNSDGEMTPRVRFTAVPYAFNALKVAGLTVTDTTGTLTVQMPAPLPFQVPSTPPLRLPTQLLSPFQLQERWQLWQEQKRLPIKLLVQPDSPFLAQRLTLPQEQMNILLSLRMALGMLELDQQHQPNSLRSKKIQMDMQQC